MKKHFKKTSIAFLSASLLISGSAFSSDAEQDPKFLKKKKEEPAVVLVTLVPVEPVIVESTKDRYLAMEATYNFNRYRPHFIGMATTSKNFQDSGSFGIGAGMFADKNFRSDVILSYTTPTTYKFSSNSNTYKSRIVTTKLMFNGTYDFNRAIGEVSPYLSAGIGAACNSTTTNANINGNNTHISGYYVNFAYQGGAGLAYTMENQTIVDLGYRFADNGPNKKVSGVSNKRLQSQEVLLGLKVPF